ncbi:ParB/RepB/Spo0J family partition protein [Methylobacterium mesophilicum]
MIKNSFPLTPLAKIRHGHDEGAPAGVCNVRVSGREDGLDELAASIASVGLLSPLVVVRHEGLSYVADGNRRLAALLRLAAAGTIPADIEVDVVERDAATAREVGLAANLTQSTMHEADQMAGFAELAAGGLKPKDIAARFGVSVPHVKKLLALGSVAPCILDAWRAGKHGVAIESVKAFTLAPSIDEQERVYAKLSKAGGSIYSHQIREELGAGHSTETLLKRVGVDAYKAAGGAIVKDLFGDTSAVSDRALLQRLSDERLIARRDELRVDGWAWVELESDLPMEARYSWPTVGSSRREPSEAEAARIREIETILEAEDDGTVSDEEADALATEHRTIEVSLMVKPGPDDRARSGCVISWGWDGAVSVREYVLRPADVKAVKAAAAAAVDAEPEVAGPSAALLERISEQMTLAVQDALPTDGRVAIAALLAGATCADKWAAPARVRLDGLDGEKASIRDGERFEALLQRYLAMSVEDLLAAAGKVLARGIDLRSAAHSRMAAPADRPGVMMLAGALDQAVVAARLSDRWDAEAFFKAVPRAAIVSAIEEACGSEAAARAAKMKKGEVVAIALAEVVPTGWLPREIRWPGYAGPGSEPALAEAA